MRLNFKLIFILKRTFIAIDIPLNSTVKKHISNLRDEFRNERIKWVEPHQYHITLQFLGSIDDSYLNPINLSLDRITRSYSQFSLSLKEFGVFKDFRNPRILWIGFKPCEELSKLKYAIEDEMVKFNFEKSGNLFSPHLTIGRIKYLRDKQKLKELIEEYREKIFQKIEVKEIIFYESLLKSQGPEYVAIKKHFLS